MAKGFTLIESVIAIAVLAIIAMFAITPLNKFIASNKVSSDVLTVTNIINTARSKAISSKKHITICGQHSDKKCSSNWAFLKVFYMTTEKVIYKDNLSANYQSIQWSAFQNKPGLTIAPTGYTAQQNGTLYLCHKVYPQLSRSIVVSKSGRTTIKISTDKIEQTCSNK